MFSLIEYDNIKEQTWIKFLVTYVHVPRLNFSLRTFLSHTVINSIPHFISVIDNNGWFPFRTCLLFRLDKL